MIGDFSFKKLLRVGLVVDLTFTNKYYHPLDMCKIASDYYKIAIEGHEVPDECFVQQLIRVIDSFNKFVKEGGNPDQFTIVEDTTPTPEAAPRPHRRLQPTRQSSCARLPSGSRRPR